MKYSIIIVSSITYAIKAKNEFAHEAIYCRVEKVKKISNQKGCGYGVVVRNNDLERGANIMRSIGIKIIDIVPYKDGEK
jgi:hypothetical protein